MASKKELVEAYSFSRRRLVTAFVSGAPGGREVEPVRPGKAIVGGIALAVLLIAGAVIAGVFAPRTPADWRQPGVLVAEETGADYVILQEGAPPRPVINTTSAQLIFGSELEPTTVSRSVIGQLEIGPAIGIFGAPQAPPSVDSLVPTGWTACTSTSGGVTFRIAEDPRVTPMPHGAVVVRDVSNQQWLVTSGPGGVHRLKLGMRRNAVLNRFNLGATQVYDVINGWLNLVPEGTPLTAAAFDLHGQGSPSYGKRLPDPALQVGDLIMLEGTGQVYLLGEEAPIQMTPFATAVYRATTGAGVPDEVPELRVDPVPLTGQTGWPTRIPEPVPGNQVCLVLHAESQGAAQVGLAGLPKGPARAPATRVVRTRVAAGAGAYVLSGSQGQAQGGQPWLIDSSARRYRLAGALNQPSEKSAPELLGYGKVNPPTIASAWIEPFPCGPRLSRQAAMASPDPSDAVRSCRP